jgi:NADPH:quinone reductase-like Zn-dependent oxidoreductase
MASAIPTSMRAIALAAYGKPSQYDIATLPTPQITKDNEVLIKVHAASINPIDVKLASGITKMFKKDS